MKKSTRQTIRTWVSSNTSLYSTTKSVHKVYCKLTSPIHTLPNFLIVGAAKGGTSSLYDYLIQHPSISPCVVKEPNYFSMYYYKGDDWYRSFFPFTYKQFYLEKLKKKYKNYIESLIKYNEAYFDNNQSIVPDHEYDNIKKIVLDLEQKYNFLK